jgi:hypothetical protein
MLDHLFRNFEIRDDAVAHRPDRLDIAGGTPQHHLGVVADGTDLLLTPSIDRGDDRRFVEHDAATLDVDKGIRGPEVNRHIARQCAEKTAEHVKPAIPFPAKRLKPCKPAPEYFPGAGPYHCATFRVSGACFLRFTKSLFNALT